MNNHFKIFIPFYNVEKWAPVTLKSIMAQEYENFECVLIDDLSTDNSAKIISSVISGDERFSLIQNKKKKYVIENLRIAAEYSSPKKEDIIVVLDGDDWFSNRKVLSVLNEIYKDYDCWLTYGSYVEYPSKTRGKFAQEIPPEIIETNKIRQYPWVTGHLQTFKFGLWQALDPDRSFREPNVEQEHHFMYGWDLAWMLPLVELAGEKSRYIKDILYVYNRENPLNCDKENHSAQLRTEQIVRNMLPYKPIGHL